MIKEKFCTLIILDGFGENPRKVGNAIKGAGTPYIDSLKKKYPYTQIMASEEPVGLINGQMGDSEVGHMNIGAGRIVYQHLLKINKSIEEGSFFKNKNILTLLKHVKNNNSNLHITGLLSDGGVHAHINHLLAYLKMAKTAGIKNVYIHVITDGRDTDHKSSLKYIKKLEAYMSEIGIGKIASISGRFYAMDREQNYDRTKKFYDTVVFGQGEKYKDAKTAINKSYANGVTDEFIIPCLIEDEEKIHTLGDNDGFIMYNYRKDRPIQFLESLTDDLFDEFERKIFKNMKVLSTTRISKKFSNILVAYEDDAPTNTLSEVISKNKFRQLKIAETTKYAHVTYYLNGTVEKPYEGEDRKLFVSDKLSSFALAPHMQAGQIAYYAIKSIKSNKYKLITLNIANGDMVGHTGSYDAALVAVTEIDKRVKQIVEFTLKNGGCAIVTADHGNIDEMITKQGNVSTAHSIYPVPFIIVSNNLIGTTLRSDGKLGDVAPTILKLLGIKKPKEMTGNTMF